MLSFRSHSRNHSIIGKMSRTIFGVICGGIALQALYCGNAAADGPKIRIAPIQMIEEDRDARTIGGLTWRGGFAVTIKDPRFGGLSALQVSADGNQILAVTDKGEWFRAELTYRDGMLSGLEKAEIFPLLGPTGQPITGKTNSDAESLAQLGPNDFAVSFERVHRIWRYNGAPDPALASAIPVPAPARFVKLPDNGGIEAMTPLCDGRLLAIAERSRKAQGTVEAWVQAKSGWRALTYPLAAGLRPTGATTLPNCDILVVERSFSLISGLEIRIVRIPAAEIDGDTALQTREIARFQPPVSMDNFEGISVRQNEHGDVLVYIVSDDNFSPLQRTLLVMYRLDDTAP